MVGGETDELLAFYDFSAEHWVHLRTTNPIESTFSTVKLRTKVTRGAGSPIAALTMVFKLGESTQTRWRAITAPHLVALVRNGARFKNGHLSSQATARIPDAGRCAPVIICGHVPGGRMSALSRIDWWPVRAWRGQPHRPVRWYGASPGQARHRSRRSEPGVEPDTESPADVRKAAMLGMARLYERDALAAISAS